MPARDHGPNRVSRRRFLQLGGAVGVGAFLAGCGTSSATPTPAPPTPTDSAASPTPAGSPPPPTAEPLGGTFRMATPVGYIDVSEDGRYPSLERFTEETGVSVDYQEVVEDNEAFFLSDLQEPLDAEVPTGWDIVVLTDWMIQRLAALGWLEEIDTASMANYPANLEEMYTTRPWDPGNRLAAPYQSGMTGLGHDQAVTGRLTSLDALFAETHAGRLTYLDQLDDTVGLSALRLGLDPGALTQAQFEAALAEVEAAVDSGIVARVTSDAYVEELLSGKAVLAMAWSGDVQTLLVPNQAKDQDFRWRLPDEGAMIWTDNMSIPRGAENKLQAEAFIDWYYVPANAAQIAASVNYVCPVKGAAEAMEAIDPDLADEELIFPTAAMRQRLHEFVSLDPERREAWEEAFDRAIAS